MYNKLNGYGEIHDLEKGYEYKGNWMNGQKMGSGREEWKGFNSYEGNYEYDKKEEKGDDSKSSSEKDKKGNDDKDINNNKNENDENKRNKE